MSTDPSPHRDQPAATTTRGAEEKISVEVTKIDAWHVSRSEHFKAIFDHLKHVSTLATGSILLIATFLEKLFKQPNHPGLVTFAVASFLISVIASTAAYGAFVLNFPRDDRAITRAVLSGAEKFAMAGGLMITWLSFVTGVGSVAAFFFFNWNP